MLTKQISSENVELNRNHKNSCRVQRGEGKNANKTKKMKPRSLKTGRAYLFVKENKSVVKTKQNMCMYYSQDGKKRRR